MFRLFRPPVLRTTGTGVEEMDIKNDETDELRELCAEIAICLINANEDFESCGHCSCCLEIDRLVKFSSRSVIALLKNDRLQQIAASK